MNNQWIDIAIQKIDEGDLLAAEKFIALALKENDKNYQALHTLGHLNLIKGNIDYASLLFIKALAT